MAHSVGDVEDVGKDALRHAGRAVGRNVSHDNASCRGGGEVNDIVARGEHANVTESGQRRYFLLAKNNFVGQDGIGIGCTCDNLVGSGAWVDGGFAETR